MSTVKLFSNQGKEFVVSKLALDKSKYLKEHENDKGSYNLDYSARIVELVAEFLEHYKDQDAQTIPSPLQSTNLSDFLSEWDVKFIEKENDVVFELINAGESLGIDHLHDLACAKIAAFMKDKSPEDIADHFTIECQLTTDEAKQLGLEVEES